MVVGFGTSILMVPILALSMNPFDALIVAGVIDFFNNIWKIALFPRKIDWSVAIPFSIAGVIAAVIGATITVALPVLWFKKVLGLLLIVYVIYSFYKPTFTLKKDRTNTLIGGGFYGFIAGFIGMGGPIRGAFLTAFNLTKGYYVATNGVIAGLVDAVRVSMYWWHGEDIYSFAWPFVLIGLIILSFLSALVGRALINKVNAQAFRKIIMVFLAIAGLLLLIIG